MPLGCVVYIPVAYHGKPLVYPYAKGQLLYKPDVISIHSAWGFLKLLVSIFGRFSGASKREASDDAGLHVFFISVPKKKRKQLISSVALAG